MMAVVCWTDRHMKKKHPTNVAIFKTCTGGRRTDTDLINETTIKRQIFSSVMRSASSKEPHYIKETETQKCAAYRKLKRKMITSACWGDNFWMQM